MPKIAVWISLAGWAGLASAAFLAGQALFDPPHGVPAFQAALAFLPHAIGALLTIGAAEALAALNDIASSDREAVAKLGTLAARAEENGQALAELRDRARPLGTGPRLAIPGLPGDLADRIHAAGWEPTSHSGGRIGVRLDGRHLIFDDERQLRNWLDGQSPPR